MKPDDQLIAEVRELDAKATKGYWAADWGRVRDDNCGTICRHPSSDNAFGPKWEGNKNFIAAARDLLPDLANRLEAALKAIEDAPHGHNCKLGRPNKLKIGTVDFPCTCWKSRALNKPTKPTPKQIVRHEPPSLQDCLNWYSQNAYCGNCGNHNSIYIRKGVKRKGLRTKCEKCACTIDL